MTAYRDLALYYDWIMSHVDYGLWIKYLRELLDRHSIKPVTILELASGTCKFPLEVLSSGGGLIIRSDLCVSMLLSSVKKKSPV